MLCFCSLESKKARQSLALRGGYLLLCVKAAINGLGRGSSANSSFELKPYA